MTEGKKQENKIGYGPVWAVLGTFFMYFGAQIMAALVILPVGLARFGSREESAISDWLGEPYMQAVALALVLVFTFMLMMFFLGRFRTTFKSIGWKRPSGRDVGYALAGAAIYFFLAMIAIGLLGLLIPGLDLGQEQQIGFDRESTVGAALIYAFISLVIIVPVLEELLIRGFLFTGLRNKLNFIWSALISSALFGVAHLQLGSDAPPLWVAAADTFIMGVVASWLREKTGSLWPCIILHAIKNGIAYIVIFVVG